MLTEFHFDEDFLVGDRLSNAKIYHDVLLDRWEKYGCLILPGDKKRDFLKFINRFPPKYQSRWKQAFAYYKSSGLPFPYQSINEYCCFSHVKEKFCESNIKTIFIDDDTSSKFGLEDSYSLCHDTGFEMLGLDAVSDSHNFRRSEDLSVKDIPGGEKIDKVWNERFCGVAKHSKTISIIDRYFAENVCQDIERNLTTSIERLIKFLSNFDKPYSFIIYSDGGRQESFEMKMLHTYFNIVLPKKPFYKDTVARLEFSSCNPTYFMRDSHDRYLRFDDFVYSLGKGMDIFRKRTTQNTSFMIKRAHHTNFNSILSLFSKNRRWSTTT